MYAHMPGPMDHDRYSLFVAHSNNSLLNTHTFHTCAPSSCHVRLQKPLRRVMHIHAHRAVHYVCVRMYARSWLCIRYLTSHITVRTYTGT